MTTDLGGVDQAPRESRLWIVVLIAVATFCLFGMFTVMTSRHHAPDPPRTSEQIEADRRAAVDERIAAEKAGCAREFSDPDDQLKCRAEIVARDMVFVQRAKEKAFQEGVDRAAR